MCKGVATTGNTGMVWGFNRSRLYNVLYGPLGWWRLRLYCLSISGLTVWMVLGPRLDVVLCQDSIRMSCTQDRNSVTGLLELGTPNLPTSKPVVQSLPRVSD